MTEYDIFRNAFLAQKAVDDAVNEVAKVSRFTKPQMESLLALAASGRQAAFDRLLVQFRQVEEEKRRVVAQVRGAYEVILPRHPRCEAYASQVGWMGVGNRVFEQGEGEMTVVQQLAAFDSNRADVHDMVDMVARAEGVQQVYYSTGVPVPQALSDGIDRLRVEIETHKREAVQKRLREIAAQKTTLLSVTEKREALDKEEADLKASLDPKKADTPAT